MRGPLYVPHSEGVSGLADLDQLPTLQVGLRVVVVKHSEEASFSLHRKKAKTHL